MIEGSQNEHVIQHILLFMSTDSSVEGVSSPTSGKEPGPSSPAMDKKKTRRKKSMNQKGDSASGQAEGKTKNH